MQTKKDLDFTNHFKYLKSSRGGNSGQLLCGLFALPAPTPEQRSQPTASAVGGAQLLLGPPALRSSRASVGRKNLGGKGAAAAARMRTSSLWPGGVSLLLIFVTFLTTILLFVWPPGAARGASSVGCSEFERERETDSVAWPERPLPLYPALSVFCLPTGEPAHYYAFCFILLHRFKVI